ncbi:MAG: Fe-S cluster assembly protein NifU [Planctomycetes bacterium GWF2_41_51]|nr:MAG: Fe-S cluster assembly protein NifU [Planctomycetes bacterium GWF2_41_51]HBG26562.1 Fe-S cluster assembly protein NifU [Phycisphaerales bacterium]
MWDYNPKVMEYFLNPKNAGEIENPDGVGEEGSLACGDALKLTFKLDKEGRIADAKFKTFGCASAIASASIMTEMIKGLTLDEASKITNKDIVEKLGGLPEQKMHCSVMGMEALQAAIANYHGEKAKKKVEGKIVCTCFGVTDIEIEKVVLENNLDSVEQVTNYCKAGGGCGSCRGEIQMIIDKVRGKKEEGVQTVPTHKKLTNIQKIQLIQKTINEQIRPLLKAHGGDIDLIDVEGSKVIVAFRGMCSQCPTAEFTMKDVVEARLHEFVSEDIIVEEQTV